MDQQSKGAAPESGPFSIEYAERDGVPSLDVCLVFPPGKTTIRATTGTLERIEEAMGEPIFGLSDTLISMMPQRTLNPDGSVKRDETGKPLPFTVEALSAAGRKVKIAFVRKVVCSVLALSPNDLEKAVPHAMIFHAYRKCCTFILAGVGSLVGDADGEAVATDSGPEAKLAIPTTPASASET